MRSRPLVTILLALLVLRACLAQTGTLTPGPLPTPAGPAPFPASTHRFIGEQSPPLSPAVEGRGIWIEMKTLPPDEEGIRKIVRSLARCNFNFLLVEVTYEGATLYPGPYQDARFKGLDPLAILTDEAHRNHLEVHAWIWSLKQGRWRADDPAPGGPVLAQHPDWAAVNQMQQKVSPGSSYYWLCPSRAESREFVISQAENLVRRYPIDGIHLDYIRTERTLVKGAPPPYCFCDHCRAEYERLYHVDPITLQPFTAPFRQWMAWREGLITSLVEQIAARVRSVNPNVSVSAAVYPDPQESRRYFSQDWKHWLADHTIDFVTPMLYRDYTDTFVRRVQRYVKDGVTACGIVLPGVGVNEIQNRIFSHDVLIEQVQAARDNGMLGTVLFSYSVMNPYLEQFLINKVYAAPARVPFRHPREAEALLNRQAQQIMARPTAADGPRQANWLIARASDLDTASRTHLAEATAGLPLHVAARWQNPPAIHVEPASSTPVIDGSLSDALWTHLPAIPLALNENGGWANAHSYVKLAADRAWLYVAFHCEDDSMVDTVARTRHEIHHPWTEDHVAVYVDPGPSRSQYVVLRLNPVGRQGIEKVPDENKRPPGVDTPESAPSTLHWEGRVKHGEKFWNAEYRIPLAELFALHPGSRELGINFVRAHRVGHVLKQDEWTTSYGDPDDPLRFGTASLPQ